MSLKPRYPEKLKEVYLIKNCWKAWIQYICSSALFNGRSSCHGGGLCVSGQMHLTMIKTSARSWPACQPLPLSSPSSTLPAALLQVMKIPWILSGVLRFRSLWESERDCEIRFGTGIWEREDRRPEEVSWQLSPREQRGPVICEWAKDKIREEGRVNHTDQNCPHAALTPLPLGQHPGAQDLFPFLCTHSRSEMEMATLMLTVLDSVIYLSFPQLIRSRLHSFITTPASTEPELHLLFVWWDREI